jgi:transcriptional regulator with XRE-family HTH domain
VTPADLLAFRRALGLTQRELAERLGVPQATIWRWESGQHPIQHPTILRLALEQLASRPRG